MLSLHRGELPFGRVSPTPRHEATRVQQGDSTELVEVEADPLDAFMSNMEDELTKEPWLGRVVDP